MTTPIEIKLTLSFLYLVLTHLSLFYDIYAMVLEGNHERFPPMDVESKISIIPNVGRFSIVQTFNSWENNVHMSM